jgi:hypothetical protein
MKTLKIKLLLGALALPILLFAQDKPSRVIVLCDVSSSITGKQYQNSPSIRRMKAVCEALLKHYPEKSTIDFYIVSSNAAEAPFLHYEAEDVDVTNQAYVLKRIKKLGSRIDASIDSATMHAEGQTCILSSVENAYETFNAGSSEEKGYYDQLIIFSDMMEQCRISPLGRIWMNDKNGQFLTASQRQALDSYKPGAGIVNGSVNILLFNTSPDMDSRLRKNILAVWMQVFSKLGSRQAKAGRLSFLPTADFSPLEDYRPGY